MILNKAKPDAVTELRAGIQRAIDDYNRNSGKPYVLSAAIGGDMFEMSGDDQDFLRKIDELMYKDKIEYYKTHDRRGKR